MENFVKIAVLDNEIEARLIESIMTERQIPHVLKSYHDEVYGSLFQLQKGWGSLQAPLSHKEEIMEIITEIRKEYIWEEPINET